MLTTAAGLRSSVRRGFLSADVGKCICHRRVEHRPVCIGCEQWAIRPANEPGHLRGSAGNGSPAVISILLDFYSAALWKFCPLGPVSRSSYRLGSDPYATSQAGVVVGVSCLFGRCCTMFTLRQRKLRSSLQRLRPLREVTAGLFVSPKTFETLSQFVRFGVSTMALHQGAGEPFGKSSNLQPLWKRNAERGDDCAIRKKSRPRSVRL